MNILTRISREPVAIAGLLIALYSLSVAFDVLVLTNEQYGAVGGFLGAVVFFLRWLTTPSGEVVVQQKPDEVTQTAGPAAKEETGTPVHAQITTILGKA